MSAGKNLEPRTPDCLVFVDESISDEGGFILTALVVAFDDVSDAVRAELRSAGYTPGTHEYKSSQSKAGNDASTKLRSGLQRVMFDRQCGLAIVVSDIKERDIIGKQALTLLANMCDRGDLGNQKVVVHFDEGISFGSGRIATKALEIRPKCDSRAVLGIQLADMCAHMAATMLRCSMGLLQKLVPAGENSGYDPEEKFPLEFELWATLRYSMAGSTPVKPPAEFGEVEALGLLISEHCTPQVATAARKQFATVYMGCIH